MNSRSLVHSNSLAKGPTQLCLQCILIQYVTRDNVNICQRVLITFEKRLTLPIKLFD